MTIEEVNQKVQGIFDNIFNSVTKAEPGGKPIAAPSTTVLSLMKPGLAINPRDFRNPWTPGNVGGSKDSAINTARLVDVAPKMSALYTDSGNSITQIYKQILDGVSIPAQAPNPALEQQLTNADNVLYRTVNITDPDTGEITPKRIESQLYRDYLDNKTAYENARMAYVAAFLEAQKTTSGQNTWPLISPSLQLPVKTAFDRWRAGFADRIEQNIAIMTTSSQNALQKAFNNAQTLFEGYGVNLEETGTGLSVPIQRSTLLPSDWYSANSASKWTIVDSASGTFNSSSSSDFTSFGGSAGFSLGLFSIGGSAGHSSEHRHASSETTNFRISFEYTLVTIRRPWMTFNLLGTKTWNLGNLFGRGAVSNGTKLNQTNSQMPLYPTSFVVVRNVKISASWSATDADFIRTKINAGANIGIGPFSIGGSYASSKTNEKFSSGFANGMITVPGVQIIGWINQVVPFCPPA
jgi:hypothetical protein